MRIARIWIKWLLTALFGMLLLLFPSEAAQGVLNGVHLALGKVIPALFPYFVLSGLVPGLGFSVGKILSRFMNRVFHLPSACAPALILGLIGGYPVGARTGAQLYRDGKCTRSELAGLLTFCNNAGPGFFIAFMGNGVFHSLKAGLLLYTVHVCSALLTGVLLRTKGTIRSDAIHTSPDSAVPFTEVFSGALSRAVESSLAVGGTVVFFSVLLALLNACGILCVISHTPLLQAVLAGSLELTSGISSLPKNLNALTAAAAAGLTGWGGLCVHCQTLSVLSGTGVSAKRYLAAKGIHGLISAAAAFALFSLPGTLSASALSPDSSVNVHLLSPLCFVFVSILLFSLRKRGGKTGSNKL